MFPIKKIGDALVPYLNSLCKDKHYFPKWEILFFQRCRLTLIYSDFMFILASGQELGCYILAKVT